MLETDEIDKYITEIEKEKEEEAEKKKQKKWWTWVRETTNITYKLGNFSTQTDAQEL